MHSVVVLVLKDFMDIMSSQNARVEKSLSRLVVPVALSFIRLGATMS